MKHIIVVSYDDEQHQTFFDAVKAETLQDAIDIVEEVRGAYAFICTTLTAMELDNMSCLLKHPTTTTFITKETVQLFKDKY